MFCTRCGSQIPDGMKFCTHCGAPVGGAAPAAVPAAAADAGSVEAVPEAPGRIAPGSSSAPEAPEQVAPEPTAGPESAGTSAAEPAAPGETVQMPSAAPRVAPDSTAPTFTQLPPTVPQDDIAFAPEKRKGRGGKIALIALACVLVAVLAAGGVWFALGGAVPAAPAQEGKDDTAGTDDDAKGDAVRVDLTVSSLDISSYPQVSIDIEVDGAEDGLLDGLTAADFHITETTPDGGSSEPAATRATVSGDGDEIRLVYSSDLDSGISRTVKINLDEMSGAAGSASATFTAPTAKDDGDDEDGKSDDSPASTDQDDYILPDSATHRYSASELSKYSDWELYVARNEIYARHGREFQNQDLQNYFNGKDWYQPRYTPEEFDANVTLSDVELANAETIRSVEESRGSSYL